jgi:raffinose/stachyose/melibiose transport system substrate-binding protein
MRNCIRSVRIRQASWSPRVRLAAIAVATAVFALGVGASEARPAGRATVTLNLLAYILYKPAFDVLVPNFERVYPNVTVNATYASTATVYEQLVTTELAAGNGPDLIQTSTGSGASSSVTELARAGYLAPLVRKPWVKWSLPSIISGDKYGQGLFAFGPVMSFQGIFTNDDLFKKLGLEVPQTFLQLLAVCQQAKADDTIPLLLPAQGSTVVEHLLEDISLTTVYAGDKRWTQQLKAGTATFDGTAGWHAALQVLVDLKNAGCLGPGSAGTSAIAADAEFAQGQALMYFNASTHKGTIDAGNPQFAYSMHPFPNGSGPGRSVTLFGEAFGVGVNARASAQSQAAAQEFIDFIARPKQDALAAKVLGDVTQYQLLHGQLPAYFAGFAPAFATHEYGISPAVSWWNPGVAMALNQDGAGLITGQTTIDQVLQAMDAAWQQGPA